jgi:hypothetical protein
LDLSIPVSPLVIRAQMFFVFKGQPDFFRMRDKLAISTDEEISGSASRKLPAPHIGVSSIFKEKTLTLYQKPIAFGLLESGAVASGLGERARLGCRRLRPATDMERFE